MTYNAHRIFRVLDRYHTTRVQASTTGLLTLNCFEEVTITSAIHWAGTYYTTTPWQAHDPPTTTTSYHDILQSTRLQNQSTQPQSTQVTDGQPGSSSDVGPHTLARYLQSIQRRYEYRIQWDDRSDDESLRDHTYDHDTPEVDISSPSANRSESSVPYDWAEQQGFDSSDYRHGFMTTSDGEDGDAYH